MTPTCETCRFVRSHKASPTPLYIDMLADEDEPEPVKYTRYRCHRTPPNNAQGCFPEVSAADWCGEYQAKEAE